MEFIVAYVVGMKERKLLNLSTCLKRKIKPKTMIGESVSANWTTIAGNFQVSVINI